MKHVFFCFSNQQGRATRTELAQVKELILWRDVALGVSATQARLKDPLRSWDQDSAEVQWSHNDERMVRSFHFAVELTCYFGASGYCQCQQDFASVGFCLPKLAHVRPMSGTYWATFRQSCRTVTLQHQTQGVLNEKTSPCSSCPLLVICTFGARSIVCKCT